MVLSRRSGGGALGKKLRSRGGLTLMELLVSLALTGFLTVGVAMGVSATGPVLKNSLMLSESQLLLDTLVKSISAELRYATKVVPLAAGASPPSEPGEVVSFPGAAPFSYRSRDYGEDTTLYNVQKADGSSQIRVMVRGMGFDLVGSGTYSNMDAWLEELVNNSDGSFSVKLVIRYPDGMEQSRTFTVCSTVGI